MGLGWCNRIHGSGGTADLARMYENELRRVCDSPCWILLVNVGRKKRLVVMSGLVVKAGPNQYRKRASEKQGVECEHVRVNSSVLAQDISIISDQKLMCTERRFWGHSRRPRFLL